MRIFIIIILSIIFLCVPALALDPMDAGKQMISGGLNDWITNQADSMISDSSANTSDASTNIFSSSIRLWSKI
jgi:hypothetical protein